MKINKNSLQNRINNLSEKTGVKQNILLKAFFYDAFLKRLARSSYSENFIFKGGFLLSTSLEIKYRSTMDIDFSIDRIQLEKETIINIIKEISNLDVNDEITFKFINISEIRVEDIYGGFNIELLGRLENIKETVSIDIATGDPITPQAIDYQYKCMFENAILSFKAYNYETILAEKLQTLLTRGIMNSRSKDFYDIYIIYNNKKDEIDYQILKEAFVTTCKYRGTIYNYDEAFRIVSLIKEDEKMNIRWKSYKKKYSFASNIEFEQTIEVVNKIVDLIFR